MSSSELHNRSHPGAPNANPLNKWASNKSAIQALPSNLKVVNRDLSSSRNIKINFLKCNGVIAPVSNAVGNKLFTLDVSTLNCFINYTDFNKLNPDTSVVVKPEVFSDWYTKYQSAQTPAQGYNIYEPSAIVSYCDNTGKRLNYICKITNIISNQDASGNPIPQFTFDTSTVVFYDYTSYSKKGENIAFPIANNPEISKIDTNFLSGFFVDIRIDFDPLYDPSYDYNADISFFLQSDMKIVNNNGKYVASLPMSDNFIGYRCWSPINASRNQVLEVYVDNISYFTYMFESVFSNRTDTPQDSFKPSTTLEFVSRNGTSATCIVQITDSYIFKDSVIFNLDNEIVKMYDDNGVLVSSYKSISKVLKEGSFTQVRMDIDSAGCGYLGYAIWANWGYKIFNEFEAYCEGNGNTGFGVLDANCLPFNGCANQQGCFYKWNWACCTTHGSCPDECNCLCNQSLRACGASNCLGWLLPIIFFILDP